MRKTILALTVAVAASAAVAVIGTVGASSGQAATPALVPTLTVMPVGDSITYGYKSSNGNGYRGPLWDTLKKEGYSKLDFAGSSKGGTMADRDNEGHSGYRIAHIAEDTAKSIPKYKPDVVLIHAGTNDMVGNFQITTAADRIQGMVSEIEKDDPKATIILASLINSDSNNEEKYRATYTGQLRQIVSKDQAAGKHISFVDMSPITKADRADGLHPNDRGYAKMADVWAKGIADAASRGWIYRPGGTTTPVTTPATTPSTPVTTPSTTTAAPAGASSGSGAIKSGLTGKCLDLKGNKAVDGTAIQLWTCNNTKAQTWTANSDGSLRNQGKCLDAYENGKTNNTKLVLWNCHTGANQIWEPYQGGYRNPSSGRCLDAAGGSAQDGTAVILFDCKSSKVNQQWSALGA